MNRKQTFILWASIALILLCIAFPPYEAVTPLSGNRDAVVEFLGYHGITNPPSPDDTSRPAITTVSIDTLRMVMQIGAICIVGIGLYFTAGGGEK